MKEADDKWFLWQRNVVERFKDTPTEDIKAELKKNALSIGVLVAQVEGDFNFGSIVRSCNSFGVFDIFYYGASKHYDRRATLGTHLYSNVVHLPTLEDVRKLKEHYVFVGVENNVPKTEPLTEFVFPPVPLLIIGEENAGIPREILEMCDHVVEIPSRGSVRSLNAGCAASIVLYDHASKMRDHHTLGK